MKNHFIDSIEDQFCEISQNNSLIPFNQQALQFIPFTGKDEYIISQDPLIQDF